MKPENILKKGFSVTRYNGKPITKSNLPKKGEVIETQLIENKIISTVK